MRSDAACHRWRCGPSSARRNGAVADAYAKKYKKSLKGEFASELGGAELTLADALDSGDAARIDAAKAKVEDESLVYSSDDRLEAIVRNQHSRAEVEAKLDLESQRARAAEQLRSGDIDKGKYAEALAGYEKDKKNLDQDVARRAEQNMRDLKGEYGTMAVGGDAAFEVMIKMRTSGYSTEEIDKLIKSGGKLSPEEEIYYAVHGGGTDEDMIKRTLAGKTPEEIDRIRKAYNTAHPENDVRRRYPGRPLWPGGPGHGADPRAGRPVHLHRPAPGREGPREAGGAASEDGALPGGAQEVRADGLDRQLHALQRHRPDEHRGADGGGPGGGPAPRRGHHQRRGRPDRPGGGRRPSTAWT